MAEPHPSSSTVYEFRGNARFVKPYEKVFRTFVKRRWLGRQLLDVLTREFEASFDEQYYRQAILSGSIRVNKQLVDCEFVLRDNQEIEHRAVIQEPPVPHVAPIRLLPPLSEDGGGEDCQSDHSHYCFSAQGQAPNGQKTSMWNGAVLIAIDKPPGIPTLPSAACFFNSLVEIVKAQPSELVCLSCAGVKLAMIKETNANLLHDLRRKARSLPTSSSSSNSGGQKSFEHRKPHFSTFQPSLSQTESKHTPLVSPNRENGLTARPSEDQVVRLSSASEVVSTALQPSSTFSTLPSAASSPRCPCLSSVDMQALRPLHRLDRLTSGVVILGASCEVARGFDAALRDGLVKKTYVARVVGNFRLTSIARNGGRVINKDEEELSLIKDHDEEGKTSSNRSDGFDGSAEENVVPSTIESVLNNKRGRHSVCGSPASDTGEALRFSLHGEVRCVDRLSATYTFEETTDSSMTADKREGKRAETEFEFVYYDEDQDESIILMRPKTGSTQLLYLGHPIPNDPKYGPPRSPKHTDEWFTPVEFVRLTPSRSSSCCQESSDKKNQQRASGIFLHAWRYSMSDGFEFETELPAWCVAQP